MNGWRWWLVGVAALAAMFVASLTAPPPEWDGVLAWAASRRAELAAARTPCPVLVGEPQAGASYRHYGVAATLGAALHGEQAELLARLREDPRAEREPVRDRELFVAVAPALAALRAGARAVDDGSEPDAPDCLGLMPVVDALLVRVRDDVAAAPVAAVDALLDTIACGLDLAAHGEPIAEAFGVMVVARALVAASDDWLDAVPTADLPRLAAALARADAALRSTSSLPAAIAVQLVGRLQDPAPLEPTELGMRGREIAWRHGFSVRRSGVARATGLVAAVREFERVVPRDAPWSVRRERLRELAAADRADNSDLFMPFLGPADGVEAERRGALAALRVLRTAVAIAAGASLPPLADPLADAPLLVVADGERVRCAAPSGAAERRVRPRRG